MSLMSYRQTYKLTQEVSNMNAGYIGVFHYIPLGTKDTLFSVTDAYPNASFCKEMCDMQMRHYATTNKYTRYIIRDLNTNKDVYDNYGMQLAKEIINED